ncbi:MAG TPA: hypothetical protein VMI75_21585 [Polyangiaceae bacterium]|nr:hypothetical protein [Polyangiaceae bacterium]
MPASRRPSVPDLIEAVTGSHTVSSDPPAARWLDRRVGHYLRRIVTSRLFWLAVAHALGFAHARLWSLILR